MSKFAKYVMGVVVTAVILFLIWYFSNIVTYILISAVLAIIGQPIFDKVMTIKIFGKTAPKWAASMVTLIAIWAVGIIFVRLFIPLIIDKLSMLAMIDVNSIAGGTSLKEYLSRIDADVRGLLSMKDSSFSITEAVTKQLASVFNITMINNALSSLVSLITELAIALFSITFVTFFFLKEDNLFQDMIKALFPIKYEPNVVRALDSITTLLKRYFTGILIENVIMMLVVSTGLMLFGSDAQTAFFIGLTVGVLNVVPYIGPLIGLSIGVIITIISPWGNQDLLTMIIITACVVESAQLMDNFLLQPILYSNSVKAHPLEIFIVILIAGSVAGVVGMLLAIPSYNVIRVFAKEFFNNYKLVQQLTHKM